jgi:indolepyruvate ferredoxin oxidoreductase
MAAFDPFGRSAERRQERALIAEYRDTIQSLLPALQRLQREVVLDLARLPTQVRGYGHIKAQSLAAAQVRRQQLLRQLEGQRRRDSQREEQSLAV